MKPPARLAREPKSQTKIWMSGLDRPFIRERAPPVSS